MKCRLSECWVWNGEHWLFAKDWLFWSFPSFAATQICSAWCLGSSSVSFSRHRSSQEQRVGFIFLFSPKGQMDSLFFQNDGLVSAGSSWQPQRGSWLMMERTMTTWTMAAEPFSCYGVWMRMMTKMIMRAPTDNDLLLQRWMQNREHVEKHVKTGVKRSANEPTAQTNEGKSCLFNSSQKEVRQSRESRTHTHPITLNTQTHVISSLDRGKTHTHCGNASPQQASQPHPLW